jgi:phosphotransferase family enzyme
VSASVADLPTVVERAIARARRTGPSPSLCVSYVRSKPGRGLLVGFRDRRGHAPGDNAVGQICLVAGEDALRTNRNALGLAELDSIQFDGYWPGVLRGKGIDVAVQSFPDDSALPALKPSCAPGENREVSRALETAVQLALGDQRWRLASARAQPLAYKPSDRCVIRYRGTAERPGEVGNAPGERASWSLVGKLYRRPSDARVRYTLLKRLYREQRDQQATRMIASWPLTPVVPRPLAVVESLGLVLSEDVQFCETEGHPGEAITSGTMGLRPRPARTAPEGDVVPVELLRGAAVALARIHTSSVTPVTTLLRTDASEALRARERAARLEQHLPGGDNRIAAIAERLATRLEDSRLDRYRPSHGSFKPGQLLFRSKDHVIVTDFDRFALASPSLDVGYFLAYLRPPSLSRNRIAGQWFTSAAAAFQSAYEEAMSALGVDGGELQTILARSPLYEAALMLKIANRRVHRLNSPRPREIEAMLGEIDRCLTSTAPRSV